LADEPESGSKTSASGGERPSVANAAVFDAINWQQPWMAPLRNPVALRLAAAAAVSSPAGGSRAGGWRAAADGAVRASGLANHRGLALHFVDQSALPEAEAYEAFISRTGGIPTRDNLHDFFNALIWLTYPASKRQLNAIQAAELSRHANGGDKPGAPGATRGKLRDRATIFDENAAILLSSDPAIEHALREHDWQECLVRNRAAFGVAWELRLFGHALLEKLVQPYKAITAHVWVIAVGSDHFSLDENEKTIAVDRLVAHQLVQGLLTASPTPLPVLGVPGWAALQNADFYADRTVFRDKRIR
jgi:hypothetical protein